MNSSVWQVIINEDDKFNIILGYYPVLKMNDFMKDKQEYIKIPYDYYNDTKIDVISSNILKDNTDGKGQAEIYISNPNRNEITDILVENLTTKIVGSRYDEDSQSTIITLEMDVVKEEDIAKSEYNIVSITYLDELGGQHVKEYSENNIRRLDVTMYRKVNLYLDFVKYINQNENIYLTDDIKITDSKLPNNITYTAILDGNNKTLDLNNERIIRGYFMYYLRGIVKNLKVKNMNLVSVQSYIGFFRYCNEATITNIDISNSSVLIDNPSGETVNTTMYVGGMIGQSHNSNFDRLSINDFHISRGEDKSDEYIAYHYVGGIIGESNSTNITNSYAYNLTIDNMYRDSIGGRFSLGGIAGTTSSNTIKNCYTHGTIDTEYSEVGGIVGRNSSTTITNNYSYMLIESGWDNVGGIVGNLVNAATVTNNMFIGKLINKNSNEFYSVITASRHTNSNVRNNYALESDPFSNSTTIITDTNNLSAFDVSSAFIENNYYEKACFYSFFYLPDDRGKRCSARD